MDARDYSPVTKSGIRPPVRSSSRSRTPQVTPKRDRNELDSSDEEYESHSPSPRKNISLNSTASPNIGWSDDRKIGFERFEDLRVRHRNIQNDSYTQSESSFNRTETIVYHGDKANAGKQSSSLSTILGIVVVILFISVGIFKLTGAPTKQPVQCPEFKELTHRLKHQDQMLLRSLKRGTEDVLNRDPTRPSVFLLAYSDERTIENDMMEILNATASCMKSKNPVQLKSDALATEAMRKDYGEVINSYKEQLRREGVMYVADIDKVPIEAAKAFHAICDTVTPLVGRLVVLFTMHLKHLDRNMSPNKIINFVEKELENNWYKKDVISDNTLRALIGRVTDQVFLLHSENEIA